MRSIGIRTPRKRLKAFVVRNAPQGSHETDGSFAEGSRGAIVAHWSLCDKLSAIKSLHHRSPILN